MELFAQGRQIGCQQPGFFFSDFPVRQDIRRNDMQLGQLLLTQPQALTGLGQNVSQNQPGQLSVLSHQLTAFLAQNVHPAPLIRLFLNFYRAKFRISCQQHACIRGKQLVKVVQQGQLAARLGASPTVAHPQPHRRNGTVAKSQVIH
jgi:hypothetical protein